MKLLLDIGNTRIKWAFDVDGVLSEHGSAVHRGLSPEEAARRITDIPGECTAVAAVNVAGAALESVLQESVVERFGVVPEFVRTAAHACGVTNGYTAFQQLGVDRWAAIVGAWHEYQQPLCVADIGTAATIDIVGAAGVHQGGMILPGVQLMTAALHADTSDIESFAQQSQNRAPPGDWFGRDTRTAVERGAVFALRASIDAAARMNRVGDEPPLVVLTGGDSDVVGDIPACRVRHEPHLVLRGLSCLLGNTKHA